MGKSKKSNLIMTKKVPLENQLMDGKVKKGKNKHTVRLRTEETAIIDSNMSKKILDIAKRQKQELDEDHNIPTSLRDKTSTFNLNASTDHDMDEDNIAEHEFMDDLQINDEDKEAFERFQNPIDEKRTRTLADIIMERIQDKQTDIQSKLSDADSLKLEEIDPKIKEMYDGVRQVMKCYRSGKVPKAFKVIPRLRNWEQILLLTEPHNWSAAAMFQGTRIFSAVLSPAMAQRFYNLVLLPRIRDDLCEFKKLNTHLYRALKRALFKPAAFMKGIILPLLEAGDCTLREAIIFGSVIAHSSIPVLHSSACLLKICEMDYTGANSIFIRYFLDKRYALPYRVIDAAVFHFLKFEHDKRVMPVLWHQSLLSFAQGYKGDISMEQKEALLALLRKKSHPKITPEIRRELLAGRCRDADKMDTNKEIPLSKPEKMYTDEDVGYIPQ